MNELLPKNIARKKINYIFFEIELSDYKHQECYPMNGHFWVLLTPAIVVTWYHRILAPGHKLLMLEHLFQLAHVILNHQHIQN